MKQLDDLCSIMKHTSLIVIATILATVARVSEITVDCGQWWEQYGVAIVLHADGISN